VETKSTPSGDHKSVLLGSLEVTLRVDPDGTSYATATELRTVAPGVAREVPQILAALLFAQRAVRDVNDQARHAAVEEMAQQCQAARDGRLTPLTVKDQARVAATYHLDLLTNGGFRIEVEPRLNGIVPDVGGRLTAGGLAAELLTTLAGPYRVFYLEMVEAALYYWRTQRPSPIESTWNWGVALRQLGDLTRRGVSRPVPTATCANCRAIRPFDQECLRCGSSPEPVTATTAPSPYAPAQAPSAAPPSTAPAPPPQPVAAPTPVAAPAPVASPTPTVPSVFSPPVEAQPELAILPARELPVGGPPTPVNERDSWPLATLPRRLGAWVLDVVSGGLLAAIAGTGVTSIVAATGGIGSPDDATNTFGTVWFVVFSLYLAFGWMRGETLGTLVLRLRILRAADRSGCGLFRTFLRGFGELVTLAIGLAVFAVGIFIDSKLYFIQGTPDMILQIAIGLLALYAIWLGSGQQIVAGGRRQSLADKIAGTIVAVRP
jgi:uncharacterized RDD family membrane protein YckC